MSEAGRSATRPTATIGLDRGRSTDSDIGAHLASEERLASHPSEAAALAAPAHSHSPMSEAAFRPTWSERLTTVAAIGGGGFCGANARYLVGIWAAGLFGTAFPWATLLINVSGSFVLGFYLTLVTERFTGRSTTRLFLATGFLGAYTTFSTFSYETVQLAAGGVTLPTLAYVVGSLVLGLVAVVGGILCAHAL
jgi:CrcB protein